MEDIEKNANRPPSVRKTPRRQDTARAQSTPSAPAAAVKGAAKAHFTRDGIFASDNKWSTRDPYDMDDSKARNRFWEAYNEEAEAYDKESLEGWKNDIDMVLLFSALFSAINTAFIIESLADIKPDPSDTTNTLLRQLIHHFDNSTFPGQDFNIPEFSPASTAVSVNGVFFASLSCSLFAAFGAVLGKQWLHQYARLGPAKSSQERGRDRQRKLDGMESWYLHPFIETLPVLLQISLVLFQVALIQFLWPLNRNVTAVVVALTAFFVAAYIIVTMASVFHIDSPFQSPITSFLRIIFSFSRNTSKPLLQALGKFVDHLSVRSHLRRNIWNVPSTPAYSGDQPNPDRSHVLDGQATNWLLINAADTSLITTAARFIPTCRAIEANDLVLPRLLSVLSGCVETIGGDKYRLVQDKEVDKEADKESGKKAENEPAERMYACGRAIIRLLEPDASVHLSEESYQMISSMSRPFTNCTHLSPEGNEETLIGRAMALPRPNERVFQTIDEHLVIDMKSFLQHQSFLPPWTIDFLVKRLSSSLARNTDLFDDMMPFWHLELGRLLVQLFKIRPLPPANDLLKQIYLAKIYFLDESTCRSVAGWEYQSSLSLLGAFSSCFDAMCEPHFLHHRPDIGNDCTIEVILSILGSFRYCGLSTLINLSDEGLSEVPHLLISLRKIFMASIESAYQEYDIAGEVARFFHDSALDDPFGFLPGLSKASVSSTLVDFDAVLDMIMELEDDHRVVTGALLMLAEIPPQNTSSQNDWLVPDLQQIVCNILDKTDWTNDDMRSEALVLLAYLGEILFSKEDDEIFHARVLSSTFFDRLSLALHDFQTPGPDELDQDRLRQVFWYYRIITILSRNHHYTDLIFALEGRHLYRISQTFVVFADSYFHPSIVTVRAWSRDSLPRIWLASRGDSSRSERFQRPDILGPMYFEISQALSQSETTDGQPVGLLDSPPSLELFLDACSDIYRHSPPDLQDKYSRSQRMLLGESNRTLFRNP